MDCKKIQADENIILSKLPKEILEKIKETDEHPFLQMYSLCHEGDATVYLMSESPQTVAGPKRAIQSIQNIVTKGVKLFKGHNADNSAEGRKVVGEIVYSFNEEIEGKLHHIMITYHAPQVREEAAKLNSCSQEADWHILSNAGKSIAESIEKLTGVSMNVYNRKKPAFAKAVKLAMVQADDAGETTTVKEKNMTYDEIRNELIKLSSSTGERLNLIKGLIHDFGVFPRHIFTENDLREDHEFKTVFEKMETYEAENKKLKEAIEAKDGEIKKNERAILISDAKTRLTNIIKEQTLPDNQAKFIGEQFNEDLEDITDDGLKQFIEGQKEIFKKVMSFVKAPSEDVPLPTSDGIDTTKDYGSSKDNPIILDE